MCCKNPCGVSRCRGCPGTNWNAFTWLWEQPASLAAQVNGSLERQFAAQSRAMFYPGDCDCTWITSLKDLGRDTTGDYNGSSESYPIASMGSLQFLNNATRAVWEIYLTRAWFSWYWTPTDPQYGAGWNWDENYFDRNLCGQGGLGYYYGHGIGWGYGGYGYGYAGWAWWAYNAESFSGVRYTLESDAFDCRGGLNLFTPAAGQEANLNEWPAFIQVSRIAL